MTTISVTTQGTFRDGVHLNRTVDSFVRSVKAVLGIDLRDELNPRGDPGLGELEITFQFEDSFLSQDLITAALAIFEAGYGAGYNAGASHWEPKT